MKKLKTVMAMVTTLAMFATLCVSASVVGEKFTKYEIISTAERKVVGVDTQGLVIYCENNGKLKAYDVLTNELLFELEHSPDEISRFVDGRAFAPDKENGVGVILSKSGEKVAEIPGNYVYSKEFKNGLICFINRELTENVYTIIDRKGKIIVGEFYVPECELENGNIVIANAGGGFSLVEKDGTVRELKLKKNVRIEDAISLADGTYAGSDGNVYSANNKCLFEGKDYDKVSPINKNYILAVKKQENGYEKYIIDIKDKKETIIKDGGYLNNYIYSGGYVSDGRVIVGDDNRYALVDLKTGELLEKNLLGHTGFSDGVCTVIVDDGAMPVYRFMKSDGEFFEGEYLFATGFEQGFAVAVEPETGEVVIVEKDGAKTVIENIELKNFDSFENINDGNEYVFEKIEFNGKTVEKTDAGNICINKGNGIISIFIRKPEEKTAGRALVGVGAVISLAFVAVVGGYAYKRLKRRNEGEKENGK